MNNPNLPTTTSIDKYTYLP